MCISVISYQSSRFLASFAARSLVYGNSSWKKLGVSSKGARERSAREKVPRGSVVLRCVHRLGS